MPKSKINYYRAGFFIIAVVGWLFYILIYPFAMLYFMVTDYFHNRPDPVHKKLRKKYGDQYFYVSYHPYDPYEPALFKPLPLSSRVYMSRLPKYENLSEHCFRLPTRYGGYLLPLAFANSQWEYLCQQFREYKNEKIGLPPQFYKNLPGVREVLLRQNVFYTYSRIGLYSFTNTHVGSKDSPETFNSDRHLRYESSVTGAITALYMHTHNPILSLRSDPNARYARKIGGDIEVPYGVRVEVIAKGHFKAKVLHYDLGAGLYDSSVEVKDGVCIKSEDIHLQEDTAFIIV